jgi:hypothetical protein
LEKKTKIYSFATHYPSRKGVGTIAKQLIEKNNPEIIFFYCEMHHLEFSLPNFGQQDCENLLGEHFSETNEKVDCWFILFDREKKNAVLKQEKSGLSLPKTGPSLAKRGLSSQSEACTRRARSGRFADCPRSIPCIKV